MARAGDSPELLKLVDKTRGRHPEIVDLCEYLSAENNRVLFDDYGILPVIGIREMWRDGEGTRLVDPQRADNIVYDHRGEVLCVCPTTGEMRSMAYWGYEKKRRCIKYRCPAML